MTFPYYFPGGTAAGASPLFSGEMVIPAQSIVPGQVIHMTMSTTATAAIYSAIQYIRDVYGGNSVTQCWGSYAAGAHWAGAVDKRGICWKARSLTMEEMLA